MAVSASLLKGRYGKGIETAHMRYLKQSSTKQENSVDIKGGKESTITQTPDINAHEEASQQ